ncbi:hypothetical protein BHE74_00046437 [Ensete ventricosum]|nr:hypothetical protein BHE74_00046437 [Ensete ventricosum]
MALRKVDNPSTGCRQAHKWSGASVPELRIQASLLLPWLEHTARTTVIYLGQEHKTRVQDKKARQRRYLLVLAG